MTPTSEPKTVHVWLPSRRSLCDRRARPARRYDDLSDEEFEADITEQENAPACGSCLVLVNVLRLQAAIAYDHAEGRVHPPKISDAWTQLRGTRWELEDFAEFLSGVPDRTNFDRFKFAVDPVAVRTGVDNENQKYVRLREWRKSLVTDENEDESPNS